MVFVLRICDDPRSPIDYCRYSSGAESLLVTVLLHLLVIFVRFKVYAKRTSFRLLLVQPLKLTFWDRVYDGQR
jgi:hypothetical protein